MSTHRLMRALLAALMLSSLTIGTVAAKRPAAPPAPEPPGEQPLTPAEIAASDAKVAAAEAYLASQVVSEESLSSLACVSPESTVAEDGQLNDLEAVVQSCTQPSRVLGVEARDQRYGHYCGPAVGQVIANWSWAMASGKNKYSQPKIAGWMQTDVNGSTNAHHLEYGLEVATAGSPRRPANWDWVITYLRDSDGDGQFGDQLHDFARASVSGSKMPLAIPVKPHDRASQYHLSSWPRPVSSMGHWIAIYGWYAYWTNTDTPHLAFTDSSRDEGGSTGKFWDPTRHLAAMIREHTGRFVW